MKRYNSDPLLDEVLRADELEACRRRTLATGLKTLRHRRRRRRLFQFCGLLFLAGLSAFVLHSVHEHITAASQEVADTSIRPGGLLQGQAPKIKVITDEELFSLFPGRRLALIGKPGHQQLVFLDEGGASGNAFER